MPEQKSPLLPWYLMSRSLRKWIAICYGIIVVRRDDLRDMTMNKPIHIFPQRKPQAMRFAFLGLLFFAGFSSSALADVRLPSIFADHMVLQQSAIVPVWGWAAPGETVTVTLADQKQNVTADSDGKWKIELSNLKAGEPQEGLGVNA